MITTIAQLEVLANCARGGVFGSERSAMAKWRGPQTWVEFVSHDSIVKTLRKRKLVRYEKISANKLRAVATEAGLKLLDEVTARIWPEAATVLAVQAMQKEHARLINGGLDAETVELFCRQYFSHLDRI